MKKVNRAELRGIPLEKECLKANTTTHEYGPNDNRIFCRGLYDGSTEELIEMCLNCKANIENN